MNSPKIPHAPQGYRPEWQHAPRWSKLPYGYFRKRRAPLAIKLAALLALLALLLAVAPQ